MLHRSELSSVRGSRSGPLLQVLPGNATISSHVFLLAYFCVNRLLKWLCFEAGSSRAQRCHPALQAMMISWLESFKAVFHSVR